LDPELLRASIAGLPDAHVTGSQVDVGGTAGSWTGRSGVADLRYGRQIPPNARFRIASVTKAFTAVIVLQLAGEHRLRLDQPVQRYLPQLFPATYPTITVGQLLNHTSGLPESTEDAGADDPAWVVQHRFDRWTPQQIIGTAVSQPMAFPPGTQQRYNGVNYFVAGMLIEAVTGRSYAHELQQRILRPLRLRDTYLPRPGEVRLRGPHTHGYVTVNGRPVDITDQRPTGWSESGMVSTTADLRRFLTALYQGRLLAPAERTHMFTIPTVPYTSTNGGCAQGPDAGTACFSMGLQRTAFPNGLVVWGKSGGMAGYSTLVVGTRDSRRVLALSLTPTGNRDGSEGNYQLKVAAAAFDPELATVPA
jgi:D-alanyl-D-alanine carboxypeptidase